MSSPYEDKPDAGDTTAPGGTGGSSSTTTTPAPALVSASGPVAAPGEATWGNGPGLHVRYAGRTAVGLVREHNEDNFVIANLTTGEQGKRETSLTEVVGEGGQLFAVCDGMGGAAAGEVASQMAVDVLGEAMRRGGVPKERDVLARRLVSAVEEAGRRIFDSAQKERSRRGMGTTATAAVLIDKVLFVAEVGDSRAYLLRNGQLKQLTKDQSLVNQLIEAGHLTEAEAEAFEHSNIILQALGTSETVQVDLTFVELRRGDRLMLCSDGLSGLVHADTLRETLSAIDDPAECTSALVRFAEASGGHDNITVVVIDFDGEALELPRETDSFGYLQYPLVPAASAASTFADEEVTEASKPLHVGGYDTLPPYSPPVGPRVDTNPWLWISAGLAALLVGAWLLAASDGAGNLAAAPSDLESVTPDESAAVLAPIGSMPPSEGEGESELQEPAEGTAAQAPEEPTPAVAASDSADTARVPVRVYSDVENAVLFVNGEPHGPLPMDEGQPLDLAPGAYRFEARSQGNVAATSVVNVQAQEPVDVYLRLPSGANGPGKSSAPVQADKPGASVASSPAETATTAAAPAPAKKVEAPKAPIAKPEGAKADTAKPAAPAAAHSTGALAAPTAPNALGATQAPPAAAPPKQAPISSTVTPRDSQQAPAAPVSPKPAASAAPSTPVVSPPTAPQAPKPTQPPVPKSDSPIPENPF